MTYERFLKITLGLQKSGRVNHELYKLGVDVGEVTDPYHAIINELFHEVWSKEGVDWLEWFMWESDFGHNNCNAHEADGTPICYDFESTWNYLRQYEIPTIEPEP